MPVPGYSIVLPPGWQRIPLRSGTDKAIRSAVRTAFADLPRDAPLDQVGPHRLRLERQLARATQHAREQGGIDMYLPVGPVYQAPVAASFVVSELSLGPADPADVAAMLMAGDDAWQPVTADGADGVRIERTAGPAPRAGIEFGSRRVDYIMPVPGRPDRWLATAFSTFGAGDPGDRVAELLTELFDAIMSTFRWDGRLNER
jgi:hypothetical protein